jgi:hypothetical protein
MRLQLSKSYAHLNRVSSDRLAAFFTDITTRESRDSSGHGLGDSRQSLAPRWGGLEYP